MGDVGVASTDPKNITVNISSQPCMTQEVVWGSLTILPYIYIYTYVYEQRNWALKSDEHSWALFSTFSLGQLEGS